MLLPGSSMKSAAGRITEKSEWWLILIKLFIS